MDYNSNIHYTDNIFGPVLSAEALRRETGCNAAIVAIVLCQSRSS